MKHVKRISKRPAMAYNGMHPNVIDSIKGLLANPIGVIRFHLGKADA